MKSDYYNEYTYQVFKTLASLNCLEETELEITEQDLDIMKTVYNNLYINSMIDFEQFLKIIKSVSMDVMRPPITVCMMIYKQLKKD